MKNPFSVFFCVVCEQKKNYMSQAFVKESEEQWLHDVQPTLSALVVYLSRENNGIRVYEVSSSVDSKTQREVHKMSNGLDYAKNAEGRWEIVY